MSYEDLLDEAYENMPDSVLERERFEVPKATGFVEGTKTVLKNFGDMSKLFNRAPEHFQKFLLKELATPGVPQSGRLVLGRKVQPALINEKIKKYADLYVICPDCGKPDTSIESSKEGTFLTCQACGKKSRVKELV